ncbi:uncharacterized protein LOC131038148 isoform X1 [Cryptomeria japonica]|uniref:uncharacterized protein LOC131038148 isoform X1 n=2 Tax=Cryptomeria japonica TaxID=3369 RepID=UPI0027DA0DB0|nr:uncharacterized protein LOC131038148 isoform X1 [Cryptomeria japonica]XP_059070044.1 uncharacterized protein LOC131038148 isoform X1 [Cryptomeria japonica]
MDEAHQILLNGLEQAGVVMPTGVSSIEDVASGSLVSICSQTLHLINETSSFPTSMAVSMADRFRLCADLATAIKELGYRGDLSFHQFLYPSEEDAYKLLKFMLERVSKSSSTSKDRSRRRGRGSAAAGGRSTGKEKNAGIATIVRGALQKCMEESQQGLSHNEVSPFRTCSLRLANSRNLSKKTPPLITLQAKPKAWLHSSVLELNAKNGLKGRIPKDLGNCVEETDAIKVVSHGFLEADSSCRSRFGKPSTDGYLVRSEKYIDRDWVKSSDVYHTKEKESGKYVEDEADCVRSKDQDNEKYIGELEDKLSSLTIEASQMEAKVIEMRSQEALLTKEIDEKKLEIQMKEEESLLLKTAVDMAMNSEHPREYYVEELQQQIAALKLKWDTARKPLEEKKANLENSLLSQKSKIQHKMEQLKDVQKEITRITAKIHEREKEEISLAEELENAPKVAARHTYIRRITELTKNSKKQDADIARIVHDTQQLQRESNGSQDRLRRIYALVDEIVFRDAKKTSTARQAYRLLTTIHENFNETFEKVYGIDKVHREIAEYEAKLEAMQKSQFDVSKLQNDLDTIWKENELLEKQLHRK